MQSTSTWNRIVRIKDMCRPYIPAFTFLTVCLAALQATALTSAYGIGALVDGLTGHNTEGTKTGFAVIIGSICAMIVIQSAFDRCIFKNVFYGFEKHISKLTLSRVSRLSIGQIVNSDSGFNKDIIDKGEMALSELTQVFFIEFIPSIIRAVTSIACVIVVLPSAGVIVTVTITVLVFEVGRLNKRIIPKLRKHGRDENKIASRYKERMQHLKLVISTASGNKAVAEYSKEYEAYEREGLAIWMPYVGHFTKVRQPLMAAGQIAVYAMTAYWVWHGTISIGKFSMVVSWTTIAFNALANVGNMQRRITNTLLRIGKYFWLMDLEPAVKDRSEPIKLEAIEGSVEFKNVSFKYPVFKNPFGKDEDEEEGKDKKSEPMTALKNVSLTIRQGETVVLVGPSGSGKSTFINLLQRGYDPDDGAVFIDGIDLRDIQLDSLRRIVGIVDQDPKLWDETLRYNIAYGLGDKADIVSEEELERLARMTRIDEFYHRLGPKKFDTLIGENGVQLSGGQRQRVALARALIKDPTLLILDEATNALDPLNERLVHQAVREASKGRTCIIIAHRLSTVRHADKIVVFDKGTLVGVGSHEELSLTCLEYQALVECEKDALQTQAS